MIDPFARSMLPSFFFTVSKQEKQRSTSARGLTLAVPGSLLLSFLSRNYLRLVLSSSPPGRTGAAHAGDAGWSRQREGAGSSGRCCFCVGLSLVVFGSRLPDPIGRIWYALCLVVLADLLWWQELCLGRMMELGISRNKAVFPIFWRLVELVLLRGARRSPVTLNVGFPRWKLGAACRSSEAFFNKRIGGLLCCWSLLLLLSILAGR
jgi:hypothetical protein